MKSDDVFYSLCINDIQEVAQECINRDLADNELEPIIELIENKINWYDAISESIDEFIIQIERKI